MIRIAHVSDLHLIEPDYRRRGTADRYRLRFLSAGRAIDPERRKSKAIAALRAASQAEHVVLTGDLTEEGLPAQFEVLAEVLREAGVREDRVTLLPGNHDAYALPDAFARALQGPLRGYASASIPGLPVDLGEALLLPVWTAVSQSFVRSGGVLQRDDQDRIDALARRERMLIVAQHHPPTRHGGTIRNWIDGLYNARSATALLARHAHLHFLHGHLHRPESHGVERGRCEQVHCAGAAVQSGEQVRFYDLDNGSLRPLDRGPGAHLAAESAGGSGALTVLA